MLLQIEIRVKLNDENNRHCQLTREKLEQKALEDTYLVNPLTQHLQQISQFELSHSEITTSVAKQAEFHLSEYLNQYALCHYQIASMVLLTQNERLHITLSIQLFPDETPE